MNKYWKYFRGKYVESYVLVKSEILKLKFYLFHTGQFGLFPKSDLIIIS